jgi:cell division initiation protein
MAKLKITPLDLRNQEFGRSFRGYDPEEVRVFLELVSDEFEFLIKENTTLTERLRDLDERVQDYRNMEKTLKATLISAQKNAENYYENAKKEADLVLENAQLESRQILERAQNQKVILEEEIARLQTTRQSYVKKFKAFLREQMEALAAEGNPGMAEDDSEGNVSDEHVSIPVIDTYHPTFSVDEDVNKEQGFEGNIDREQHREEEPGQ